MASAQTLPDEANVTPDGEEQTEQTDFPDVNESADEVNGINVLSVNPKTASKIGALSNGAAGWYLNVAVSYSSEDTDQAQRANVDTFMLMVDKGQLKDTYNVQTTAYDVSLNEEATHLIIACFDLVTGQKAGPRAKEVCQIEGVRLILGYEDGKDVSSSLEHYIDEFLGRGFTAIPVQTLVERLSLSHGDLLSVRFDRESEGGGPSFYVLNYDRISFPGLAGFQVPVAAYGGVFDSRGLSFSMLAPAVSWGANINFSGAMFAHLGIGVIVAPSLVEVPAQEQQETFTVARLAAGPYVDLAGWVWLGGGVRFDLSDAGDHRGLVLLTFGRRMYGWLLGP